MESYSLKNIFKIEMGNIKLATTKAFLATSVFILAGIISYIYKGKFFTALVIFYIVLCFNTFFSIQLFDALVQNKDMNQKIIDVILFFEYIYLAWNLNNSVVAMILIVALFLTATYKYTHMITSVPHLQLLRRKISIDNAGSFIAFIVCIGIILTGNNLLLWYWTFIFTFANVYLFTIMPMYKIPENIT